jgi:NAD(P)-dependent dehydrogenase (short-subunit alcohol dehydrogenase family)
MRLKNKVAIITGAGTGIGEAIAHKFSREGARVLLAGLPSDPVKDVADAIIANGGEAEIFQGDLAEEAQARACVEAAVRSFGRINVLVNNAGIFIANAETDAYRIEDFERTIRSNIRTAFLMTKFALPHLQKTRGNVLFTGSEAGINGSANFTPYGASKAFLHAFAKGVALEQAKYGVRANCVCPGAIDTAWTRGPGGPLSLEIQKMIERMVPLGRRGDSRRDGEYFCVSRVGRGELCDGRATPGRRWSHPGERHGRRIGAGGDSAPAARDIAAAPFARRPARQRGPHRQMTRRATLPHRQARLRAAATSRGQEKAPGISSASDYLLREKQPIGARRPLHRG